MEILGLEETNFHRSPIDTSTCINRARRALHQEKGSKTNLTIQASAFSGWEGGQYQPGGTCTGGIDQYATIMNNNGSDLENMGRWSTHRIQVKGTGLSFITAYRVCRTLVDLECNTAYSQQWRAWIMKTVDSRDKNLKDLKAYLKEEINKRREIVVLIDANEGAESRTEELTELIHKCVLRGTYLINDPYSEVETFALGKEKDRLRIRVPKDPTRCHLHTYSFIQRDHTLRPQYLDC